MSALRSLCYSLLLSASGAAFGEAALVSDPIGAVARTASPGVDLLRIEADYNNDGLLDLAVATSDGCGNKVCNFELFLRRPGGNYIRVGQIGSLPFGYRIAPVSPGTARFETCSASGVVVSHTSVLVSLAGLSRTTSTTVSITDTDKCKWEARFSWSECKASEYRRLGSCSWQARAWP